MQSGIFILLVICVQILIKKNHFISRLRAYSDMIKFKSIIVNKKVRLYTIKGENKLKKEIKRKKQCPISNSLREYH